MPKKSSGRKKGIQRGIPRHRVRSKEIGENNEAKKSSFLHLNRSKLSSLGKKCFNFKFLGCSKLHLIGFTRTQDGEYVPFSRKDQIWHYAVVVFCLALSMQKTWGTLQMFLYEELRMESFVCLSVALVYDVAVTLALGVVLRPKETTDVHNSWAQISDSLKMIDPSVKCHPLDNMTACLKVISTLLVGQGIAVGVAVVSLLIDDLPICLVPMARRTGLLPEGILPTWAWRIVVAPLEWLMAWPFMMIAAYSSDILYMENGLLDIYLRQLRNINVRCMQSRRKLELMYVQLELFNRIGQIWIRFFFPPWLFAMAVTVIVTIFVTIRYTDIPLILYVFFPYIGVVLVILLFWQSYDMYQTIRASEDILGRLRQQENPYFQGMTRVERIEEMKRSKAMRPVVFPLADVEFSLDLPINTWDEILNQTLFLLSL